MDFAVNTVHFLVLVRTVYFQQLRFLRLNTFQRNRDYDFNFYRLMVSVLIIIFRN